jgi:hypothetical protein
MILYVRIRVFAMAEDHANRWTDGSQRLVCFRQAKERRTTMHPIVKQIIDRDCHVGLSTRYVIRYVISRLKDGHATFRAMPREDRRLLMQQCIEQHRENRELYVAVMYPSYKSNSEG